MSTANYSNVSSVYSNPPYHGLPVLPANAKGLTAIVTGGNGISGQHIIRVLLSHPQIWSRIFSLSRKPATPDTPSSNPRIKHISCDLLAGVDAITENLASANVTNVDYVFFTAYKETGNENGIWGAEKQMWNENGKMLEDFLISLKSVNGNGRVKRVVLQTGAKHYGHHYGQVSGESREEDRRVDDGPFKDNWNFYYNQEDILKKYGSQYGFDYAVIRPSNIIGAVAGNFMNEAIAIGLYITITHELGHPVIFPGTLEKWSNVEMHSSALLNSYIEEWACLTSSCSNEAFNAVNGDAATWSRLWPALLSYYNIPQPSFKETFENAVIPNEWSGITMELPTFDPMNYHTHSTWETRLLLQKWAQDPKVITAWEKLRDREGLQQAVWDGASWAFVDVLMGVKWNFMLGAQKLRRFGFLGTVDTVENWMEVLDDAAKAKLLPKRRVK